MKAAWLSYETKSNPNDLENTDCECSGLRKRLRLHPVSDHTPTGSVSAISGYERVFDLGFSQRAPFAGVQAVVASTQSTMWLIIDLGLRPVRIGGLDHAGDVDHVLALWASLALFGGSAGRTSPSPSWSASTV
ncbi:hypothetical protein ACQPZ2_22495 [Nocardia pseudovaccinii]|uniref:hypothetical protein n=1 Tax=Nocardia pseudovaccinii TaxID=189540 RepID=UPI003D8E9A22